MKRRDILDLLTLGLLWGLGFLLIRLAVPEFGAIVLIEVRMLLAAAILLPLVIARRRAAEMLSHWRPIALMGLIHYAVPFCLFAWAMLTLPAGYSSIVNAASPLFAGIIARIWIGERLAASRAVGLVLGISGVAILAWDKLFAGSIANSLALAAAVGGAFCYGFAAVLAKRKLADVSPTAVAGGSMAAAGLILLPLSIWLWPVQAPAAEAWAMSAILGVLCTAIAFVLYFRLIASAGPSRAISVTFLVPVFAVILGALFANEAVTVSMVIGGLVIALGTALAVGILDLHSVLRRSGAFAVRLAVVIAVIHASDDTPMDVHAAELGLPVHLTANTFSSKAAGDWETFTTLAASAELELVSFDRSRSASAFVEYHVSREDRVDGTLFTGVSAGYRLARWDFKGAWFTARLPGSDSVDKFKVRVRYRFRDNHKLGLEYLAAVDAADDGELRLGYYGTLGHGLTIKFLIGGNLDADPVPKAQLAISWQAR